MKKIIIAIALILLILPLVSAAIYPAGGTRYKRYYFTSPVSQQAREFVPRTMPYVQNTGKDFARDCTQFQFYRNRWWRHEYFCTNKNEDTYETGMSSQTFFRGKGYPLWGKARWVYPRSMITGEASTIGVPEFVPQIGSRVYDGYAR